LSSSATRASRRRSRNGRRCSKSADSCSNRYSEQQAIWTPHESRGSIVDGISAAAAEQLAFHIHAHLTNFVAGAPRQIPYGIGIAPPLEVEPTSRGPFAAGGTAFFWLHTRAADGIIHIESPIERIYTLGNFFDIWHKPLGRDRVGPAHGRVTAFFNSRHYLGNPRDIPLLAHAQIQLDVGRPLVAPESIEFPPGL
jgi:hypothetical protein